MIYSKAIATSGLPRLHSQKLCGDAFIQLNGAPYSPQTRCHCCRQMLGCIGATAEGHLLKAVRLEGFTTRRYCNTVEPATICLYCIF